MNVGIPRKLIAIGIRSACAGSAGTLCVCGVPAPASAVFIISPNVQIVLQGGHCMTTGRPQVTTCNSAFLSSYSISLAALLSLRLWMTSRREAIRCITDMALSVLVEGMTWKMPISLACR
jgi:hypothetical protein